MLSDLNMWNKIGRIVMRLSEVRGISLSEAFEIFYTSRTCNNLHNPDFGLYLMSDAYILEDLMKEVS